MSAWRLHTLLCVVKLFDLFCLPASDVCLAATHFALCCEVVRFCVVGHKFLVIRNGSWIVRVGFWSFGMFVFVIRIKFCCLGDGF